MASLDSAGFSDPFASAKTRQVTVPFIPLQSVVYLYSLNVSFLSLS
jgi:hypothetical protein